MPLSMSDYPKGGDIASTRAWLDKKGFIGIFNNWEADAILGLPEEKVMVKVPGERGEMLWGFLNTARQTTGSICSHSSFSSAPEWVGDSDVLEDLWAEACGYDIPPGLLKKESTTRTFVETKRKAQGNTIIICSSFIVLHLVFVFSCRLSSCILTCC